MGHSTRASDNRLCAIDVARAIAIMMMLQGHFVAVSLVERARDLGNPIYATHSYLRTLTAPLFLTVSGLVFVYFLGSADDLEETRARRRRGVLRGLMLVALGHGLQLHLPSIWHDPLAGLGYLLRVHVLQVVGVGLLVLSLLTRLFPRHQPAALVLAGLVVFAITPSVQAADLGAWPVLAQNYLITSHGSVFTLLPWLGYVCFGGALGALAYRRGQATRPYLPWLLLLAGVALYRFATLGVFSLARLCPEGLACGAVTPAHVWLTRFGLVLAFIALLMGLEQPLRRWTPAWLVRTGQHTLFVFVVHAMVLYGTLLGFGLERFLRRELTPWEAVAGAALFVASHVGLVHARHRYGVAWRAALHGRREPTHTPAAQPVAVAGAQPSAPG